MTIFVAGRATWRDSAAVVAELHGFGRRARILHRGREGADRIAARLAREGKVDAVRLEEDNVVKILEQHRPDWFLLFGTWAGCQDALITASRLGVQVRFIKG